MTEITAALEREGHALMGLHPQKRRRTKKDMARIREAVCTTLEADKPMTCRQIFYQLVSQGVIRKKESEYKGTICRLLAEMRRDKTIPYDWLADNTRWMRKPRSYSSLDAMLEQSAEFYRRALWDNQDVRCEIWLEKDALSGVLFDVTSEFDVPLMVTRGYPSLSFLASSAEEIAWAEKPTHIYYFGDHDPSGRDIPRFTEKTLRELAPDSEIYFETVAVLEEQIEEWNLPTRPTKRTDTRAKGFRGESVEVDAIPPAKLRSLAHARIVQHIDERAYHQTLAIEQAERDTLQSLRL